MSDNQRRSPNSGRRVLVATACVATFALVLAFALNAQSSCSSAPIAYKFFLAGHVYGRPGADTLGLYAPFRSKLEILRAEGGLRFGVLLGDSLETLSPERIEALKEDLKAIPVPVHLAPGNHESTSAAHTEIFTKNFNRTTYFFREADDLHIILDTNVDGWEIVGAQLEFLKATLRDEAARAARIFIHQHNVIWYDQNIHYRKLFPNSFWGWQHGRLSTNFWSTIVPLLLNVEKPVYVFAGDINAFPNFTPAYYEKIGKLHLVATGMEGGAADNFLIVTVPKDVTAPVSFELVSLSDERSALGKLEDYGLHARL